MKARLVPPVIGALVALLAGCGGGSSNSGPASIAPPGSLVFVEGTVRPSGELKSNVDAVAQKVAGIENLGDFIVSKLESKAREEGEPFDFEKEVEPWLGDKAAVSFESIRNGNLSDAVIAVQTTDAKATQDFIDKQVAASKHRTSGGSYKGVEYSIDRSDGSYVGVVGDFLVSAEGERAFKDAVDASQGESLAGEDRYKSIASAQPEGSLADVYVDIGGLIRKSGTEVSPQAAQILKGAGLDPSEATALASVVPSSDQVEVDLSSNLGGEKAPTGDATGLLGSLPADSFAAFAVSGFGDQLREAIDSLDASGIPPEVPPHKLKAGLMEAGINLDQIAASLADAGVFAEGDSRASLGGALVLTTKDASRATNTVSNIGLLLRASHTPGVTAVTGKASGFSIRSPELGSKPLVVAAEGERIGIGYGLPATLRGLTPAEGGSLASTPAYRAAVSSLGDTPISGFVDGPAALRLAESLVPPSNVGFQAAKRYLRSIRFIGLGAGSEGDLATAKLIVGFNR